MNEAQSALAVGKMLRQMRKDIRRLHLFAARVKVVLAAFVMGVMVYTADSVHWWSTASLSVGFGAVVTSAFGSAAQARQYEET